ncbi:MAG TPA: protein kinase [Labilithrix sp.]
MSGDSILPKMPEPGAIVGGKYEIVGVLGKGGMGVVFEAVHRRLNQHVALKMLRPHVRDDPETIARFEREARAAGQLRSPNIARVLDVETQADLPYIVMELLEGRDLEDEVEACSDRLPINDAVDYVLQACAGMHEAHAAGIVHRDLKPANLFLCSTPDGPLVKILDFGISKVADSESARLTRQMTTMGSPVYMSPEQLRDAKDVDARADVWGLGVILYELIAGRPPFAGTVTQVTAAIVADVAPPLSTLRSNVPSGLDVVVAKALEKKPEARFQSAEELAEALMPFASPAAARRWQASLRLQVATPRSIRPAQVAATASAPSLAPGETRGAFTTASSIAPKSRTRWLAPIALAIGLVLAVSAVVLVASRRAETKTASAAQSVVEPPPAVATIVAPEEPSAATNTVAIPTKAPAPPPAPARPSAAAPAKAAGKNPLHL